MRCNLSWTKVTKAIPSAGSAGWGDLEWGNGPWGSPPGTGWTKISKTVDTWTKQTKAE